jgi:3-oxoacyl-[acyl-carrier protein] reductase
MSQQGKVAVVTGASQGIGAAIAERLARDEFSVVVNYASNAGPADALVQRITAAGGSARAVRADVADPAAVAALFDAAEAAFGGIDVLVNNAGQMSLAPIADVDDASFDRLVAVNLRGVFNGLREAARRLRNGGRIVSFSSSVVGQYLPTYGVYAATKAAVEALTHVLSKELGARNITVNAIAPGPVETKLFLEGKSEALVQQMVQRIPLGRLGQPDDIAAAVSFLAGEDGRWVNGQILRVNGGLI